MINTNIYWPVYKNIENEFNNLMFNIHIDDTQLCVYSSKISDLILRSSTEIESISKELYKKYNGSKTVNIKYDEDALSHLNSLWKLEEKEVIISSYNCFLTTKELKPFQKNEKRTGTNRQTYSWNNSYQNLKHDRAGSLTFGSIKYLFDVTAALFLLNIYYKNDSFELNDNSKGTNFDNTLGSSIYSIKLHITTAINTNEKSYTKNKDFDECVYLLKHTDKTKIKVQEIFKKINDAAAERTKTELIKTVTEEFQRVKNMEVLTQTIAETIEKKKNENMIATARENGKAISDAFQNLRYEAILNLNQY